MKKEIFALARVTTRRYLWLRAGFTLVELLVVLIVIAVLIGLYMPDFTKTRERALDVEARVVLRLIQAAEKVYHFRYDYYYKPLGPANVNDINTDLGLALDTSNAHWIYGINPAATSTSFTATATRSGYDGRVFRIIQIGDVY